MSISACAELVKRADPVRFRAAMTAPTDKRAGLFALYAFNVEISRIPWSVADPMLAEIRLQYWRDQLATAYEGRVVDPHPVMTEVANQIATDIWPQGDLDDLISARLWDITAEPFASQTAFDGYLRQTGGQIMSLAIKTLDPGFAEPETARAFGQAAALATFLTALSRFAALGRAPLPDDDPQTLAKLASEALSQLQTSGKDLRQPRLKPALLTASEARPILKQVIKHPDNVAQTALERSEFRQRLRVLSCQILNRV